MTTLFKFTSTFLYTMFTSTRHENDAPLTIIVYENDSNNYDNPSNTILHLFIIYVFRWVTIHTNPFTINHTIKIRINRFTTNLTIPVITRTPVNYRIPPPKNWFCVRRPSLLDISKKYSSNKNKFIWGRSLNEKTL